jgi:hypothetical protein
MALPRIGVGKAIAGLASILIRASLGHPSLTLKQTVHTPTSII